MTPARAALDRALLISGEDVILRRIVGGKNDDVTIRANVAPYDAKELVGGILQTDSKMIISPTQIWDAQWPGGHIDALPPFNVPQWIPRINDKIIYQGRIRNISVVKPLPPVDGEIVRIEMTVAG